MRDLAHDAHSCYETRLATSAKRPHGRCARSLKKASPPSVTCDAAFDVAIIDARRDKLRARRRAAGRARAVVAVIDQRAGNVDEMTSATSGPTW